MLFAEAMESVRCVDEGVLITHRRRQHRFDHGHRVPAVDRRRAAVHQRLPGRGGRRSSPGPRSSPSGTASGSRPTRCCARRPRTARRSRSGSRPRPDMTTTPTARRALPRPVGRWPDCGSSNCRPSGRCRSPGCCWPTSEPRSCGSTGSPGRTRSSAPSPAGPLGRGRRSVALDLRRPGAAEVVRRLAERSDALIEGFRPGVAERLGVGPDELLARNPALVYGRMTGWGQDGPLAPDRRPRHHLPGGVRAAARHRAGRRAAGTAGELPGRLRRRRDVPGHRDAGRGAHARAPARARWSTRP